VVLVTPDSDRTLCTFLGISGELSTKELVEDALRDSEYFYMEGYLVTSDTARQACIAAKRLAESAGVKTAISLSDPNMVRHFKAGLLEMIGSGVDLLFANEDEARDVVGATDLNGTVAYLKTLSKEFVITRGSKGALVWDGKALIDIDPVRVAAVDTVGAGDMFAGAFLYGRVRGWDHRRAGALAASAAAQLVTRVGGGPTGHPLRTAHGGDGHSSDPAKFPITLVTRPSGDRCNRQSSLLRPRFLSNAVQFPRFQRPPAQLFGQGGTGQAFDFLQNGWFGWNAVAQRQ